MNTSFTHIKSISSLHELLAVPPPLHPLISVLDAAHLQVPEASLGKKYVYDFYMISLKDKSCGVLYGRNSFDFNEGVLSFYAPGQVLTPTQSLEKGDIQGWVLFVHPDLLLHSPLDTNMAAYSFFNYEVYEALHLSQAEETKIHQCVARIQEEYQERIDAHSRKVILSNLTLLLDYSLRFYERQFHTRTAQNQDVVSGFDKALRQYFTSSIANGIPPISHFAAQQHLSPHYFSDLIKKETGRSPKDHIQSHLVQHAKQMLRHSNSSISHIAYDLGFNYPHYFTRLFKSRTGLTPNQYRKQYS